MPSTMRHQQFPLIYMLLPNKTRETYNRAFTLLKEAAQSENLDIRPDIIMTDFEQGLIQAVELNFPTAQFKGCYYHFTQALWRKVQSVGLQSDYCQENSEVASFFFSEGCCPCLCASGIC